MSIKTNLCLNTQFNGVCYKNTTCLTNFQSEMSTKGIFPYFIT